MAVGHDMKRGQRRNVVALIVPCDDAGICNATVRCPTNRSRYGCASDGATRSSYMLDRIQYQACGVVRIDRVVHDWPKASLITSCEVSRARDAADLWRRRR